MRKGSHIGHYLVHTEWSSDHFCFVTHTLYKTVHNNLFFHWFPLCRGEGGLFVTVKYGYFRDLFPLIPDISLFSPLFFILCLSQISLKSSHLSCGLPRFLQPSCFFVSDLFGNLSSFILTMCPATQNGWHNFLCQLDLFMCHSTSF